MQRVLEVALYELTAVDRTIAADVALHFIESAGVIALLVLLEQFVVQAGMHVIVVRDVGKAFKGIANNQLAAHDLADERQAGGAAALVGTALDHIALDGTGER